MSRVLKALVLSAAATAVGYIVAEAVFPTARPRPNEPPPARPEIDPVEEMEDDQKEALVAELAAHV